MIFHSDVSRASYTLDNTGIVIENSLTNANPNNLIITTPFTTSPLISLSPYVYI
jgi:hypothetical protein